MVGGGCDRLSTYCTIQAALGIKEPMSVRPKPAKEPPHEQILRTRKVHSSPATALSLKGATRQLTCPRSKDRYHTAEILVRKRLETLETFAAFCTAIRRFIKTLAPVIP